MQHRPVSVSFLSRASGISHSQVAWLEQPSRKQYWSSLAKLKDYLACSTVASSSEPRMEWGGGWNDWDWLNLSCIVLGCSICWAPWSREYQNHTADGLLIRLHCNCDGMPGMPTMVPHHYRLMQVVALPPYNLAHMGRNLSCSAIIQRVPGPWHFKKLLIGPGSNRSLLLSQAVSWTNIV